jgi:hypothetical protein
MTALPEARIEHRLPGRMRLRLPGMRGDRDYFSEMRDALSAVSGIGVVTVAPETASILLEDVTLGDDALEHMARELGWFTIRSSPGRARRVPAAHAAQTGRASGIVGELRPSLVLILLGLAIVQAARGHLMVPALSLLWFAYVLVQDEQRVPDATPDWPTPDHAVH